ncbi:MAG TPA: PhzF family phenazine biosynthesis protein [Pyrinomonadaceae bacterium]|jgi:predicted PhzF superfamily epimerase YddE/YHI9
MNIPLYQIDAFTDTVFSGNPAAICPLEKWLPAELMQRIALENNLSETAFFVRNGDVFDIRWFSPTIEIDLCGHATLASAFVLYNFLGYSEPTVRFSSKSGALNVRPDGELLVMDFPAWPPAPTDAPPFLVEALGRTPTEVLRHRDYVAVFAAEDDIRALTPNMDGLMNLDAQGVIVTAPGDAVDFVSRYFAPGAGVAEDPVTGSAHSMLTPYWAERLGKTKLHARQLSARGGEIFCEHLGERVNIAGRAVAYMTGEIRLQD